MEVQQPKPGDQYITDYQDIPQPQQQQQIYDPPSRDKYDSSIITLTDPKEALYNFELFLRCLREDREGKLKPIGEPLLNELGINTVMASVESVVHSMNTMSNFSEEDIIYLHDTLKNNLITSLMINHETFGVNKKNRDLILGNALRFAYGFMKRAYMEGERKFWKGSVQEVKHTQETNNPPRGGGFTLNPFAWGKK